MAYTTGLHLHQYVQTDFLHLGLHIQTSSVPAISGQACTLSPPGVDIPSTPLIGPSGPIAPCSPVGPFSPAAPGKSLRSSYHIRYFWRAQRSLKARQSITFISSRRTISTILSSQQLKCWASRSTTVSCIYCISTQQ